MSFSCSTGVPPTDARPFIDHLSSSDLPLSHLHYSVLALGDSNYPHYCRTGRDLDTRFVGVSSIDWEKLSRRLSAKPLPKIIYIHHGPSSISTSINSF